MPEVNAVCTVPCLKLVDFVEFFVCSVSVEFVQFRV